MFRHLAPLALCISMGGLTAIVAADGTVKQLGRAIVQYRSEDVLAVASYEYSQRNHAGAWLLIEFAVQATPRIAIGRHQLTLLGRDEKTTYPLATQAQYLADQRTLTQLMQNATIWRRPLSGYFSTRPVVHTILFFSPPGGIVSDSAVTNLDEVAAGDLLFKSPSGAWEAGTYRLMLDHEQVKAELPIVLQ